MNQASEQSSHPELSEIDPIWTTSRTARQIHALGEVEKDISRLLSLAASSISLLTLPQTDSPDENLPQGEERSEQFVLEVSEYFERLDSIQTAIRSSLAHIRHSRIAPSAINAPPPGFLPPSLGVALPPESQTASDPQSSQTIRTARGLQEERLDRDAWKGILHALTRLKREMESSKSNTEDTEMK
ncbi:hypothetical protein J3R30DRAFT_1386368 [Lentinula aciculospora]|uniref:Mediator of RNA polymerase II transcription subunit 11 n=1 Tax=Lentinula aciculospora TaxID=153920 RepID=A0A9W9ALC7_9AGAR|nr:hypothetical protein J3R30DRAFT_1386368 [Lentinula aciculospora]